MEKGSDLRLPIPQSFAFIRVHPRKSASHSSLRISYAPLRLCERYSSMHRQLLLNLLDRYDARHPSESAMTDQIRQLVVAHADCFDRTCRPGHITASAWITTPARDRFLLGQHAKLDGRLQPGGHADGQTDGADVTMRDATEEKGLTQLPHAAAEPEATPLGLGVHIIPARYDAEGSLVE